MRKRRFIYLRLLLMFLLVGAVFFAFRQGLVPSRYSPLPALHLDQPAGWFVDWQLAEMRNDRDLCQRVLGAPQIDAAMVADKPLKQGCGWTNSVRLIAAGGARFGAEPVTCEAATAFALWMAHEVQPLAEQMLGQRVASVQDMGSYSCRNIIGNKLWKDMRSEHATANAIDIGGFTLADGRHISVLRNWAGQSREALFLRTIHQRSCRYFRVAIGPEFNAAHRNHFHFDRGFLSTCR